LTITYQAGRRIQGILGSAVLASTGWTFTTSNCSISNEVLNVATASDDSRAYRSHTITDDQNWVVDMDCYTGSGGEGHVIHCLKLSKLSTIADDQFAFRLNNTGGNVSLYIQERLSGSNNQQGPTATISQNTQYYMRFIRNGSTVYWKVYTSDSNRTSDTSATTVSLSLTSTSVRSISYIQHGSETTGNTVSGIKIDNIKIYHNMVTPSGTPAYETDFTDGYSGDTKPTNIQVGSRFEETDTRKIYHFEEGQDTEENIFNSAFTMTGNAAQTTSTDPTGKIVLTQSGGSGNQANAYRTLSSISSSNKTFTADFTFKRNTGDLANSNYVRFASVNTFTSGITGNAKRFYFSFENAGYIRVATETASDTSNTFTDATDMQAANTTKYYRFVGNGSTLVLTMYPTLSDRTNGTNADRTYQSVNFPSDWTTTDPIDTFELLGSSGYHTGNWEVSDVEMSFNSANAWSEEGI
jgi:hypothetical protein